MSGGRWSVRVRGLRLPGAWRVHPLRWRRLTRAQRSLVGVNAALALVLLWIVAPIRDAVPATPYSGIELPALTEPIGDVNQLPLDSASALVTHNPFARSRRPPAERWSATPPRPMTRPAVRAPAAPRPPRYELLGAVVSATHEHSMAMIEADPAKPGPEVYRVGDRVGPYRLTRIERERVVLSGAGRTIELRLEPTRPRMEDDSR